MPYHSVMNLAVSQARQTEDTFVQAELAIMNIRRTVSSMDITRLEQPAINPHLKDIQERLPQLHGLFIYDAQGHMRATSLNEIPNNSDEEYFIYHRRHDHANAHISEVVHSRTTGELVNTGFCTHQ